MAVTDCDSFDHYNTSQITHKNHAQFGLNSPYTAPAITTAAARKTNGLLLQGGGNVYRSFADTQTVAFGFACRPVTLSNRRICALRDETTIQLYIQMSATGAVFLYRGNGTLLGSAATVFEPGQWHYLELSATISDTAGSYDLRIDNISELSSVGSADTQVSANQRVNILSLGDPNNNPEQMHYDDLYITDGNLLGPVKVDVLRPNGGVPGFMEMSVVGAGSHYQALFDTTPDGDTSYVYSPFNMPGSVQFSEFEDMGDVTGGAIFAAAVRTYVRKEYGNTRGFQTGVYPGTADSASGTMQFYATTNPHYVEAEFAYHSDIYNTNPGTGGTWTVPSIKELRAGFRRII